MHDWNDYLSAWTGFCEKKSLADQYFGTSRKLQGIFEEILKNSEGLRHEKLENYRRLRTEHDELVREQAAAAHRQE